MADTSILEVVANLDILLNMVMGFWNYYYGRNFITFSNYTLKLPFTVRK
jgi:hypothetical protein